MTLGEKISRARKEKGYTQEQLAELLEVSRQSVSKWESDMTHPETEKLVRMGKLFDCSMDYLLNEEATQKNGEQSEAPRPEMLKFVSRERKSQKTVWGMPLYHIGRDARGFFAIGLRAKGIFAIGLLSSGIFSLGLLSLGVVSMGVLCLGLIALGDFALGIFAAGAVAAGIMAAGAISVGIASFGALSVGYFSTGALAVGKYFAVGDHAYGMIAVGLSEVNGSVYSYNGDLSGADIPYMIRWLDTNVPSWLFWAKEIFKSLLL